MNNAMPNLPAMKSRTQERLAITLVLLFAFALRVFRLEAQSLWYDEGVTAWLARKPWGELIRWTANDIQPPLAYAFTKMWGAVAGWSEFALRFVPLTFSLLTVALVYALLRLWNRQTNRLSALPLWGALLAAMHPLLVYYAQEARMYAQLGALVTLGAVLLTPSFVGAMSWRRWFGFAVAMALAAYTHYFAFFALAAFALAWIWQRTAIPASLREGWTRFLTTKALVVLLFAPWLGIMLRRLGEDASYWQGQLKALEALRGITQRFVTGETMRESTAVWIALAVVVATALLALAVWRADLARRSLLRMALCWLVVPVIAVIALATITPKFNPRYVYLALPGMLLIWAVALDWLGTGRRLQDAVRRFATILLLLLLLVPMLWANANWFFDGNFNKAQWRELATYLRPRITAEERVILVSGHAFPVWEYYAPDIPVVRLPEIDVLDVDEVLTFANTAQLLRDALETHPGAWLIQWQEGVVDPNEVVGAQLELGGREKGSSATFSQIELDRFSQIRTGRISDSPPISVTVAADFGGVVNFEGYRPLDNGDLLLFWQLPAATDADLHMAVEVLDGGGTLLQRVPDRRIAGYNYPTFRWQPNEINMARIPIVEWLGFTLAEFEGGEVQPAANYQLRVRVYDANDPARQPLPLEDGTNALLIDGVRPILE